MEEYKNKLRKQNRITAIWCVVLTSLSALSALGEFGMIPFLEPVAGDSHWSSQWRGFISGASMGICGCMIFYLLRSRKALKDEKSLKALYVREHDERQIQIWTSARASAMRTFLLLGLAAVIVSGYFSIGVSVTILACVLVNSLLGLGFKVYYSRKF